MTCIWVALQFHLTCGTFHVPYFLFCNEVHCTCVEGEESCEWSHFFCWHFQLCRWNNGPLSYLFSLSQQQQQPTFGFSSHPTHLQLMVIEGELDSATQEIFLCLASSDGVVTLPSMETILLQPGVRIVLVRISQCTMYVVWSALTRETTADTC